MMSLVNELARVAAIDAKAEARKRIGAIDLLSLPDGTEGGATQRMWTDAEVDHVVSNITDGIIRSAWAEEGLSSPSP